MHKTVMGLTDVYKYTGNEQALDVVGKLADWYVHWTDEMLKRSPDAIYKGEQGGMLEVWADLYGITKDEKYMKLAERYSGNCVFDTLDKGGDALTNDHANAGIPLSHGAARMYEITGDEKWKTRTERFFKCAVTDRGTYATSGGNSGEFWVPPHQLGHFLGASDQEFCTVYNLVRTADYLFKWTGDTKYADYIERCLYNGFLAQQNASTGMPTYFLLELSLEAQRKNGAARPTISGAVTEQWCRLRLFILTLSILQTVRALLSASIYLQRLISQYQTSLFILSRQLI